MAIFVIFVLGVGNFALHRAVMESGHPLLTKLPGFARRRGQCVALLAEFAILLAAMLLVARGFPGIGWAYLVYTVVNGLSAWLILTRRI